MTWTIWILCGLYAGIVAYFILPIRKHNRVTITEAMIIGVALLGGISTAAIATFAIFFVMINWLSDNGDNVLFRLKEKPPFKDVDFGEKDE